MIPKHRFLKFKVNHSSETLEKRYEKYVRVQELYDELPASYLENATHFINKHQDKLVVGTGCFIYGFAGESFEHELFINDRDENIWGIQLSSNKEMLYLKTPNEYYSEFVNYLNALLPQELLDICNDFQKINQATCILGRDVTSENPNMLLNIYIILNEPKPFTKTLVKDILDFICFYNKASLNTMYRELTDCLTIEKGHYKLHAYGFIVWKKEKEYLFDFKCILKYYL